MCVYVICNEELRNRRWKIEREKKDRKKDVF